MTVIWSKETVDACFELWAWHCGRNATEVARRIANDPVVREACFLADGDPLPNARRVRYWADEYGWGWKATEHMKGQYGTSVNLAALTLMHEASEAVAGITQVMGKFRGGESLTVSDKIYLDSAWKLVNNTFGDNIVGYVRKSVVPDAALKDLRSMTPAELAEAERMLELNEG